MAFKTIIFLIIMLKNYFGILKISTFVSLMSNGLMRYLYHSINPKLHYSITPETYHFSLSTAAYKVGSTPSVIIVENNKPNMITKASGF
jgi:hypothetical protein